MDSRGQANVVRNTPPPGIFTLKLRHGGRISQTLPAKYIGGSVSEFNDMVEDEWGLICLKEKVGEIGYTMDDSLSYFIGTEVGLQELVKDLDVWNLVNQSCSPKVIEIWIVKKGNGDDADECAGSAEEETDVEKKARSSPKSPCSGFPRLLRMLLSKSPAQAAILLGEPAVQVPVADAHNGDEAARFQVPAQAAQIGDEPNYPKSKAQNNLVEASLSTNSEIPVIQVPFEQEKRLKGKQGRFPKISRKRTASKDFNRQKQTCEEVGTRSSTTFKSLNFRGKTKIPNNLGLIGCV
nr:uncharacterized protein LOC109154045 [Ipomoea batatas]